MRELLQQALPLPQALDPDGIEATTKPPERFLLPPRAQHPPAPPELQRLSFSLLPLSFLPLVMQGARREPRRCRPSSPASGTATLWIGSKHEDNDDRAAIDCPGVSDATPTDYLQVR